MVTPKLRFKEFDSDWSGKSLSEFGEFKNGLNKDKEDFGFGIPFVNLMDVFGKNSVRMSDFDLVNANQKEAALYSLEQGDVLFVRSSVKPEGVGETSVVLENLENTVYSGFLIRFRETLGLDLQFKKYCFSTDPFRKKVLSKSTTSANTNINQESLSSLTLYLPQTEEQTKIATFLSSADEKFSQLTKKHDLLSQYKQGMMQKLFSQQIRFKADDGSEFGEWEETTLGALYDIGSSKRVLQEDWKISGVPFLRTREVISLIEKTEFSSPIFISEELYDELTIKYGAIKQHDILVSGVGTVGKAYVVQGNDKFYFKDGNVIWFRYKDLNNSKFIYYFFQSHIMENYFIANKSITTVDTFTIDQAKKVRLLNPSKAEQTKIANFLSAIDQKIDVVAQQLEQAKQWKKGLLQQMFV